MPIRCETETFYCFYCPLHSDNGIRDSLWVDYELEISFAIVDKGE